MAVFQAMQPVLHEQYATGAGGGAAPQGRGGYLGSNVDASGYITPPSPLEDPQAAVRRAMGMIGLNPGNISPLSNAIRKKASALVNQLVVNALEAGGSAADALEQPAQALTMLADLMRQGVSGGKIFGGKGEDTMGKIASLAEANSASPGTSPGAALAASILSNPDQAATLFLQGKYGGLGPQGLAAMTTSLQGILDSYSRQIEGSPASASNPAGLLRLLLGQPMGGGLGAPQGPGGAAGPLGTITAPDGSTPAGPAGAGALAQGAGTPSTATPSLPSALPNTAAAQLPNPAGAMGGYGQGFAQSLFPPGLMAALGQGGAPGAPDQGGYGGGMPQQMVGANQSFQPFNPGNYLPEPLATLNRIRGGFQR